MGWREGLSRQLGSACWLFGGWYSQAMLPPFCHEPSRPYPDRCFGPGALALPSGADQEEAVSDAIPLSFGIGGGEDGQYSLFDLILGAQEPAVVAVLVV